MFTTIITDCKGENEAGRQISRFNSYGLGPANLIGVGNGLDFNATIEAAGNLIDVLDATEGREGVVIVNVAPRGDKKKDGENGTSFAYFYYKNTLVISTIKGYCLSLVIKFGITKKINLLDTKEVLEWAVTEKLIEKGKANYIARSQFRSFDFVPRVAKWLSDGVKLPTQNYPLSTIHQPPSCIWHIDTFGNCKTTLLTERLKDENTEKGIKTNLGTFKYYERLKDIVRGETAIYTGSSGMGSFRFLEIATQAKKGGAAKNLNLKTGDELKML